MIDPLARYAHLPSCRKPAFAFTAICRAPFVDSALVQRKARSTTRAAAGFVAGLGDELALLVL
jgi:hypothetical protein